MLFNQPRNTVTEILMDMISSRKYFYSNIRYPELLATALQGIDAALLKEPSQMIFFIQIKISSPPKKNQNWSTSS